MRFLVAVFCLCVCGAAYAETSIEPQTADARAHLQRGLQKYNLFKYDEALKEFEAGYELEPASAFLYALGQVHRMRNECGLAVASYKAFLRENPPEKKAEAARKNIERCETPQTMPVTPPTTEPQVAPQPITPPPPAVDLSVHASAQPVPIYKKWWLWTAVGVVVVGTALGVGLGVGLSHGSGVPPGTVGVF